MTSRATDFELTSYGLDRGLQVEHIATFPIITCDAHDSAQEVLASDLFLDFDQVPVTIGTEISGVLIRERTSFGGAVIDSPYYKPLRGSMLLANTLPLSACVPLLEHRGSFRLVIRNDNVDGIVTPSDLLKLPVRLLAFTKVTYLEMLMRESLISRCSSHDEWMSQLSPTRRSKILEKKQLLATVRLDPLGLDLTDFCDKRDLVLKLKAIPIGSRSQYQADMKAIESLRNSLAHSGDYADDREDLRTFISTLRKLDEWIGEFGAALSH